MSHELTKYARWKSGIRNYGADLLMVSEANHNISYSEWTQILSHLHWTNHYWIFVQPCVSWRSCSSHAESPRLGWIPDLPKAFWLMTLAAFYTFAEAGLALPKAVVRLLYHILLYLLRKVRNPCSAERWSRGNGAKPHIRTPCTAGFFGWRDTSTELGRST